MSRQSTPTVAATELSAGKSGRWRAVVAGTARRLARNLDARCDTYREVVYGVGRTR